MELCFVSLQYGDTGLHLAARRSYPEIVKMLLEDGADVDVVNAVYLIPIFTMALGTGTVNKYRYYIIRNCKILHYNIKRYFY